MIRLGSRQTMIDTSRVVIVVWFSRASGIFRRGKRRSGLPRRSWLIYGLVSEGRKSISMVSLLFRKGVWLQ